jgi:hypothetical protein
MTTFICYDFISISSKVKGQKSKPIMKLRAQRHKVAELKKVHNNNGMCAASKAERAERSGLPRFFFDYFLCSDDKESNNKK